MCVFLSHHGITPKLFVIVEDDCAVDRSLMHARLGTEEAGKCRNLWIVRKIKKRVRPWLQCRLW